MSTIVTRAGKGSALTHNEVDANFVNLNTDKLEAATTSTLTNKTINLTSNTLTGTTAQFNTALSDGDFATLAGTETLTNKTITSPTITGGALNGTLGATTPSTVAATTISASGIISAGTSIGYSTANVNSYLYKSNDTNTGTGSIVIQAGAGSATYGGSYALYGHSHATYPGWTMAGISYGSGGKFAVNNQAVLGGGTNVFTVDASGNVVATGAISATSIGGNVTQSNIITSTVTGSVTQASYTDTGASLVLVAGTYLITTTAMLVLETQSGTTVAYRIAQLALTDNSNNVQQTILCGGASTGNGVYTGTLSFLLTVPSTTTYKTRFTSLSNSGSPTIGALQMYASSGYPHGIIATRLT
jgi:hypothetical protein